jgi:hypothetical protein
MEKGLDAYVYDPLLSGEEVGKLGFRHIEPEQADLVFDPFDLEFERCDRKTDGNETLMDQKT